MGGGGGGGGDVGDYEVPKFTRGELSLAVAQLAAGKASGPDGISAEILGIVAKRRPKILLNLYNTCHVVGLFTKDWIRRGRSSSIKERARIWIHRHPTDH